MAVQSATAVTLAAYLQRIPLIARLRSDLSVQASIEIGDALLAAPILVVEVDVDVADGYATIAEFRQRYGEHLLIGAAAVRTLAQVQAAQEAGAHFFALPALDGALLRFAREHDLLCLPQCPTPAAACFAALEGCPLVSVAADEFLSYAAQWPSVVSLVITDVEETATLAACRRAGATALRLQQALFPTVAWSPAELITTARKWRRWWEGKGIDG
ncbi:MAG: hypothetical protein R3E79_44865 [Caldilineaceae bacterium]